MIKRLQPTEIAEAVTLLKEGKLVAFPTETVYGIGALMSNLKAIEQLYIVKGREYSKPCSVHIHSCDVLEGVIDRPSQLFFDLVHHFLPGPLTIIVKKGPLVPALAVAGGPNVGIRIPSDPIALKLLSLLGEPLIASSANFSTKAPATSVYDIEEEFASLLLAVIDGGVTRYKISSTVVAIDEQDRLHLLREGAIPKSDLEKVCPVC